MLGAYRTPERRLFASQVIGAPTWLGVERYDITARVDPDLAALREGELFAKLPSLLQSLLEERFALRVHRETHEVPVYVLSVKDDSLGPRLRESTTDCRATPSLCGIHIRPGYMSAGSVDVETLINMLSSTVARVIVNQTTLNGRYSIELEWSPDQTATDKPSIFTAVQEQLGLKLESAREPVTLPESCQLESAFPFRPAKESLWARGGGRKARNQQ